MKEEPKTVEPKGVFEEPIVASSDDERVLSTEDENGGSFASTVAESVVGSVAGTVAGVIVADMIPGPGIPG